MAANWEPDEECVKGNRTSAFSPLQETRAVVSHKFALSKASLFIAHLRKALGDPPYWERGLGKAQRLAPAR
jgi:hypothetical protein